MNPDSAIPALLHGPDGVPTEAEHYIRAHGVETVAHHALNELRREREKVPGTRGEWPRVAEHHKQWAYLLHAYCHKHSLAAPAALMELTFAALSLGEAQPAPELLEELSIPADVRDRDRFMEASRKDGEADARGEPLSVNALARDMGVSRDTVRRWRDNPQYHARREFAARSLRYWQERSTE